MIETYSERDPLDQLAESFLARFRAGECPSVTEYVEKHPELAEEIRELFPALVVMEKARPHGLDRGKSGWRSPSANAIDRWMGSTFVSGTQRI